MATGLVFGRGCFCLSMFAFSILINIGIKISSSSKADLLSRVKTVSGRSLGIERSVFSQTMFF